MAQDLNRDADGVYIGPAEKTISLLQPIVRASGDLTSITLREPTAKQLSQFFTKQNATNDNGIEAMMLLISLCSGEIPPDVEKLRQRDFDACGEFLALFTKAPPPKSAS